MGSHVRTLEFRVLGPVEMSHDGRSLRVGGERQRTLLAVLLLHPNETVSVARLLDLFFDGAAGAGTVNAVHAAVSRLRRALGDSDARLLVTRPGGYMLALDDAQLDALRFERLVEEGRALAAEGELADGVARLREALALWRGPPLADVAPLECVQAEARRLEELRLLATMERIDAELGLGLDAQLIPEIRALVAGDPLRERLRGQLMLALYRSGHQAEALAVYRDTSRLLRDELGLEPSPELRELEQLVLQHAPALRAAATAPASFDPPPSWTPAVCPFKGLAAFDAGDAAYFCGREDAVSDLVARLAEWPLAGILGPSGIGKSSLLRAGLLPALRAGALPGSAHWRQALLRPGSRPRAELARGLGGADVAAALAALGPDERIVIAVDQLEELFTACEDEVERAAFLQQLVVAATDPGRRASVVLSLRADFYGRCSSYPAFATLLNASHVLVGPMSAVQLGEAIAEPVRRAGLAIEPELVEALLADLEGEPGALPLLSTSLLELWQAREGRTLRLSSYRETGGVRGAVARLAEAAYRRLSESERPVGAQILLRLVGDDDEARRRVPVTELQRIAGAEEVLGTLTDARLLTVSDGAVELSHESLVREWPRYRGWLEEDRVGRRLHAHLAHAAEEWDARGRDPGDLYRGARLTAALDWMTHERHRLTGLEREFLAAGRHAAAGEARRQRRLNRRLRGLLVGTAGLLVFCALAGALAVIKQHDASRDAHLAATEARAALGRQLGAEVAQQPRPDVAMLLAREAVTLDHSPQTEGTLLATLLRSQAVLRSFALPADSDPQVALSPDGRTLAVGLRDGGGLRFFDAATAAPRGGPLRDYDGAGPPAYSADGRLLAYPAGNVIRVRDARSLAPVATLTPDARFHPVAAGQPPNATLLLAPDGRAVYFAYWLSDGSGRAAGAYVDRWSLPAGQRTSARIGGGTLLAAGLSASGGRLVLAGDRGVRILDARSLRSLAALGAGAVPDQVSAAAISPRGERVAFGSRTGAITFVDATSGRVHPAVGAAAGPVTQLAFAAGGRRAVAITSDDRAVVWDARRGRPLATLAGPLGQIRSAALDAGAQTLYAAASNGAVIAWDLTGRRRFGAEARVGAAPACCDPVSPQAPALALAPGGNRVAAALGADRVAIIALSTLRGQAQLRLPAGDGPVTALAFSPDGQELAVAGHSGVVQLWSVGGTPRRLRSLRGLGSIAGPPDAVQSVAFSPDGRLVAASDDSETSAEPEIAALPLATVGVWHADSGRPVAAPRSLGAGNGPGGSDVLAFSGDGRRLAVSLLHGGVVVLDPTTLGIQRRLADPGDDVVALAFAPDGTLATGALSGIVQLWNPVTGRRRGAPLLAGTAPIVSLAYDAAGRRLATSAADAGAVKLWSTGDLQQEGEGLPTAPGTTASVAFAPRRARLVAADSSGSLVTWPTALPAWEDRACAVAARNLTQSEWRQLVPELPYAGVCR